jgi:hypothetical protein
MYEAFNARDIDAVLLQMGEDVDWPNAWEGGRVHGHGSIRWREASIARCSANDESFTSYALRNDLIARMDVEPLMRVD